MHHFRPRGTTQIHASRPPALIVPMNFSSVKNRSSRDRKFHRARTKYSEKLKAIAPNWYVPPVSVFNIPETERSPHTSLNASMETYSYYIRCVVLWSIHGREILFRGKRFGDFNLRAPSLDFWQVVAYLFPGIRVLRVHFYVYIYMSVCERERESDCTIPCTEMSNLFAARINLAETFGWDIWIRKLDVPREPIRLTSYYPNCMCRDFLLRLDVLFTEYLYRKVWISLNSCDSNK